MSEGTLSVELQGSSSDVRSSVDKEKAVFTAQPWIQCTDRAHHPQQLEDTYDTGKDAWMTVVATYVTFN